MFSWYQPCGQLTQTYKEARHYVVKPWAFGESLISNSGSVTHSPVTLPSANSLSPLSRSGKGR